MISVPGGARIWLGCGITDMRKGFDGLAGIVQTQLAEDPLSGQLFIFRGRRGDRVKLLCRDGDGLCLFAKRLERMQFGRSSEQLDAKIAQLELTLEELEASETQLAAPMTASPTLTAQPIERAKPVRKPLPAHLPRESVTHQGGATAPNAAANSSDSERMSARCWSTCPRTLR